MPSPPRVSTPQARRRGQPRPIRFDFLSPKLHVLPARGEESPGSMFDLPTTNDSAAVVEKIEDCYRALKNECIPVILLQCSENISDVSEFKDRLKSDCDHLTKKICDFEEYLYSCSLILLGAKQATTKTNVAIGTATGSIAAVGSKGLNLISIGAANLSNYCYTGAGYSSAAAKAATGVKVAATGVATAVGTGSTATTATGVAGAAGQAAAAGSQAWSVSYVGGLISGGVSSIAGTASILVFSAGFALVVSGAGISTYWEAKALGDKIKFILSKAAGAKESLIKNLNAHFKKLDEIALK